MENNKALLERIEGLEQRMTSLLGERTRMRQQLAALKEQNIKLREQIKLDPKTLALNDTAFRRALTRAIHHPSKMPEDMDPANKGTLLLYLDVREFKKFNDRFGQHGGDAALRHVVRVLLNSTRVNDVIGQRRVGRTGGDEFMALFEHITEAEGVALAKRLNEAFRESTLHLTPRRSKSPKAIACYVEVHIGATWWPHGYKPNTGDVIKIGDDLMWDSKDNRDVAFAWRSLRAP